MTVTVVTKYDEDMDEHYVAVINGSLDENQKEDLRQSFECEKSDTNECEVNVMYFREIEVVDLKDLTKICNIDGENS